MTTTKKEIVKLTKMKNGKIYARCPYDSSFIDVAKTHHGRWNPTLGMWFFEKGANFKALSDEMRHIFGELNELGGD